MGRCRAKALIKRRLTASEMLLAAQTGVEPEQPLVPGYCIHPERHRGDHDFRTARWIMVREVARFAFVFIILAAFVFLTGERV